MSRILGLDFGTKRIGVALSDELFLTAQAVDYIYRKDQPGDMGAIRRLIKDNAVLEVVVGLPLSMDGTYSQKTKEVVEFVGMLTKFVDVPVKTWDERLTTVQAENILLEADMSRGKRRKLADKIAAQIILQNYLDSRKKVPGTS